MLTIRPFVPQDQAAVKALILTGLVGHWGWLDPTKNPDLDDIASSYASGFFLTAWEGDQLVGTGAQIPEPGGAGDAVRIVRMSVASDCRRKGIGSAMLEALIDHAKNNGIRAIVLETTSTWQDAVGFYLNRGFRVTGESDGDTHFLLEL